MTTESLLLVGHDTETARDVFETHADRLDRRTSVDDVRALTYDTEPNRELRDDLKALSADHVYVMPMDAAHTQDTINSIPSALSAVSGDVQYCEPVGQSPAVTEVLTERAANRVPTTDDVSFVLVGFGSSSKPYHRQVAEYHAARIREQSAFDEVVTCYLLQNPAVECVRYNVSNDQSVAVPLFLTGSEVTESEIPEKLELGRGGMAYADPLGSHPRVTDAIQAELEKQRVLTRRDVTTRPSFEAQLTEQSNPIATDGEGVPR